jgi:hypothetical protein
LKEDLPIACNLIGGEQCFELVFEQGGGGILLRVRGPEGTKQFISEAFSLASSP